MLVLLNRSIRLLFGLFLYALGIVLTIRGNVGLMTWDVLHQGMSIHTGITMGQASISVGLILVVCSLLMKEKIGVATVLNMVLIGVFMDILLESGLFPEMNTLISGYVLLSAGLIVIAIASYFYIGAGFGAGPRDSMMVMLVRVFKCRVGVARAIVEGTAVALGWLLGGFVGFGTIFSVFGVSIAVQCVFRLFRFEVEKVKQESFAETFINIKRIIGVRNE
jgi:uncharacterized membrane protein YczE